MLRELAAENIRNLHAFSVAPDERMNLIVGENASGKTSFLEAVYILSRARSFRTSRLNEVINTAANSAWVSGKLYEQESGKSTRLGLARTHGHTRFHINGQAIRNAATAAQHLPVKVIHPESHRLLTGGPGFRRAFIDWGCFYQDENFYPTWVRFQKLLNQRNAALKQRADSRVMNGIEREFCESAERLSRIRSKYIEVLRHGFASLSTLWPVDAEWELDYRRGWSSERDLRELLLAEREYARRQGYTLVGPQRADLVIKTNGERIVSRFSRGQIKRATVAFELAQIEIFEQGTGRRPVLLVDDMPSELDANARELLMHIFSSASRQCFITASTSNELRMSDDAEHCVFHVEHGRIRKML
ncbi:DNA replication/repair protein RecF [Acidihalobacter ferrooxydans]|uniref:DNA replication and repair protein RecF n=1 Tax=Acidihalobacter ferrooxydans TaxID=1765967 RepID=A0A1P8UD21_9GAMM|nr:DNA replication/repair protein RecF [Acidihalobacter ferrooxydans]APZ41684.1 DNA replication/repair protein RecF [Acidihalobacter ferrooxydans]